MSFWKHESGVGMMAAALLIMVNVHCTNGAEATQTAPTQQTQQRTKPAVKPVAIATTNVTLGTAESRYVTTATLEAEHRAEIRSRTLGVIRVLSVEEGQFVEEGQLLLKLEDDDQKLKVKQAKINLNRVNEEHQRRLNMQKAGILSEQEFDQSRNDLEKAEAELEVAELAWSHTEVKSPFAGFIVKRTVDLGANVSNGDPLFEMMDVDPLLVRVHVPANRVSGVKQGQFLSLVTDSTGQEIEAKVSLISPIVDPESGTVKVTAEIQGYKPGIRPGDFVEASVVTDRRQGAMLVPSIAVFEEQGSSILFTVSQNRAQRLEVETGFMVDGMIEIRAGLSPEDIVVVKGQRNLRPDAVVDILEGPKDDVVQVTDSSAEAKF